MKKIGKNPRLESQFRCQVRVLTVGASLGRWKLVFFFLVLSTMADVKKQQKAKDKLAKLIQKFENKTNKDKQRLAALASLLGMKTLSSLFLLLSFFFFKKNLIFLSFFLSSFFFFRKS